ncbi:universal stress protein [Paractinoplanes durhamensis]|nr:universal stress protein [Actinoplanes durhamensis]
MDRTRIVVGANGSGGSIAAVRWAAAEARLRDTDLRIVVAYQRPEGQQENAGIVHAAVAAARAVAPAIEVRGVAMPGYAVPVLLHAAEEAALLVVGDQGRGGMFGAPADSVGKQVATQARCSVVVVRGRPDCDSGPVVVGVDDDAADAVIGRAFEEAALHGAQVLAVTAGPGARGKGAEVLGADLDSRLDPWRARYRSVSAQREYIDGRPDRVMVDSCRQALLAVVGPRRHGYQGVLLGEVGSRLLRRAECPVLIAR